MVILGYQYQGRDVLHNVHFRAGGKLIRYGSDEEAKPRLQEAYEGLCTLATTLAGQVVRVRSLAFHRKDNVTTASMVCLAAATNGDAMQIRLPRVGWRTLTELVDGQAQTRLVPDGIDENGIVTLQEIEEALADYVQNGSGQMDLFQEESAQPALGERI